MCASCVSVSYRITQKKTKNKSASIPPFILFLISFISWCSRIVNIFFCFLKMKLLIWWRGSTSSRDFSLFLPHVFTHISLYFFLLLENLSSKITSSTFSYIYTRFLLIHFFSWIIIIIIFDHLSQVSHTPNT